MDQNMEQHAEQTAEQTAAKTAAPVKTPYSSDGYIVDQARVTFIRYGVFSSDVNGCGWIAAFNFLKWRGEAMNEKATADELIRWAPLHGLAGTSVFRLKRMLKRRGCPTALKIVTKKRAALPETARAGILYYVHKDGPHFVAFYRDDTVPQQENEAPRFRFLNAIPGRGNHFDTLQGFLARHNVLPIAGVLVWPRQKKGGADGVTP